MTWSPWSYGPSAETYLTIVYLKIDVSISLIFIWIDITYEFPIWISFFLQLTSVWSGCLRILQFSFLALQEYPIPFSREIRDAPRAKTFLGWDFVPREVAKIVLTF